ncbi:kinesin-like protein KIF18A isoform X2 [Ambystoma mexicanum]
MSALDDDVCSHVRVVVRVRPENQKEKEGNHRKVVHVVDRHMLVFDPKVEEVSFFHGKKVVNRDINKKQNKDLSFVFDAVFDEKSTQLEVFENTTKIVIDGVLNGYNCTVLAYGATGSGKTHTMLGSANSPGVMFLTMLELYKRIELLKDEKICNVALSYLEVYNEQIRDLLGNSKPLAVCEDANKGVVVQNLTLHQPKSAEEILQMLDYGNKNRTQHPTDMNATSSRSHAVLQIYLRQQDKAASINQNVRLAKMCLIDLAGSERASATQGNGARFREGANINRSLLALGNVINALADPKSKKQHIPYRNSKLTRLLKDSLGGNCRTIMIAAVSPSAFSYEDTYNTLKYANRAKDIKSAVKSNIVSLDNHISQYVKICEQQKKEILMLKEKLSAYEEREMDIPHERRKSLLICSSQKKAEVQRFQELLKCLFTSREEIRKEVLTLEMHQKENELKTFHQLQLYNQIHMMCSAEKAVKATCKRDHRLAMLKTKYLHIQKKKEDAMKRFEDNTDWLHRVENEMRLSNQDRQIPEELSKELKCCHLQLEVNDLKTQIQFMLHIASLQQQEDKHSLKLLNSALPVLCRQRNLLEEARLLDATLEADFKKVENLVEREKAVVWADQTIVKVEEDCQPEISLVMNFPHLKSTPNTPCSAKKQCKPERKMDIQNTKCLLVRPFDGAPCEELKENINVGSTQYSSPPQKQIRRRLLDSPLLRDLEVYKNPSCSHTLDDSLSKDLIPIVYTPDALNTTITLTDHHVQPVAKCAVPPLPIITNKVMEKPSYMAMTSAAVRKRKLPSSISEPLSKEDHLGLVSAKRVRQDNFPTNKVMRVRRTQG